MENTEVLQETCTIQSISMQTNVYDFENCSQYGYVHIEPVKETVVGTIVTIGEQVDRFIMIGLQRVKIGVTAN